MLPTKMAKNTSSPFLFSYITAAVRSGCFYDAKLMAAEYIV